jgi:predicted nucleotidyltransferase
MTRKPIAKTQLDQALTSLKAAILLAGPVNSLYLFGSASRSDMSDQSDIDLLVVMEKISDIRPAQKKLRSIQTLTPFPIDLVWVERAEFERKRDLGGVCFIAYHEGICLFQAEDRL